MTVPKVDGVGMYAIVVWQEENVKEEGEKGRNKHGHNFLNDPILPPLRLDFFSKTAQYTSSDCAGSTPMVHHEGRIFDARGCLLPARLHEGSGRREVTDHSSGLILGWITHSKGCLPVVTAYLRLKSTDLDFHYFSCP